MSILGDIAQRAVVLAPYGRDAAVAQQLLHEIGVRADACTDLERLVEELHNGAALAIISDASLRSADLAPLSAWISAQPSWSDFPFIIITPHGAGLERNPLAARLTQILQNASFLERPFHPTTLVSMTRAAMRARNRQYQARSQLDALRESEQRLQRAHDIGNIGDWSLNLATREFGWSRKTFELFGLDPNSRAPSKDYWLSLLHSDDRSRAVAYLEASAAFGQQFDFPIRVVKPRGEITWLQMRGQPVENTNGEKAVAGTFVDITQAKRAQEALAKANETLTSAVIDRTRELATSEARFRAIFDSAVQLTGLIDAKGTLIVANQASLDAATSTLEDVVGRPLWESPWLGRAPEAADKVRRDVARAAQGAFVRYDLELTMPDGKRRTFDFSMKPVRDGKAVVEQIVVEGHDITELKRTQSALMQAQKMDTLGQITGGVAHDFNNLLMAIMGNLDILRRQLGNDPKLSRLIGGALEGAKRGATLTQRLLAFSRRQDLQAEAVDLATLLDGARDLLLRSVGPMINLKINCAPGLPNAKVDAHQLELALLNLAVNSRDAMPKGGTITITAEQVKPHHPRPGDLAPGSYVRISVVDDGAGMSEETLQKAIEPFFSTKELGKGTGLGLSMVHGLAVQSGGALRMSSKVGLGTVAEIWLPTADGVAARVEQKPAEAPSKTEPATILVVDDDVLIAMSTADMLADLGHDVLEAHSGHKALEILRERPLVQLMITDYAMPGMTGLQLAQAARELKPGLRVLLASGYADIPDGAAVDLPRLPKPYMQEQLAAQVSQLLGQ